MNALAIVTLLNLMAVFLFYLGAGKAAGLCAAMSIVFSISYTLSAAVEWGWLRTVVEDLDWRLRRQVDRVKDGWDRFIGYFQRGGNRP